MINKRLFWWWFLKSYLVLWLLVPEIFTVSSDKQLSSRPEVFCEKCILRNFAKFSKFDSRYVILFQIKVFGRNIKGATLTRYFVNVTASPSYTWLRVIMENIWQRFSYISFLFKLPWSVLFFFTQSLSWLSIIFNIGKFNPSCGCKKVVYKWIIIKTLLYFYWN